MTPVWRKAVDSSDMISDNQPRVVLVSGPPYAPRTVSSSFYDQPSSEHFIASGNVGSTGKGILIGMLSAFSSAAFVAIIFAIVYFFRYTSKGRIILDRIGRPGEYDDEQAYAREEAEALERMDDLQRAEYFRARGGFYSITRLLLPL